MPRQMFDELILELAGILSGGKVDTGAVSRSLELICDAAFFDCGLVYETDYAGVFQLKEHFSSEEIVMREGFSLEDILPECCEELGREPVVFAKKGAENTHCGEILLKLFGVKCVAVAPILDEALRIQGMVAFLAKSLHGHRREEDSRSTTVLISMLGRYVGVRMYQNKLTQSRIALESILDNTGIDIYVNDFNNHDILYVNKSMAAPYGGQEKFKGQKCWRILFPGQSGPCEFCPQKNLIDEDGNPTKVYTWDYQRPFDGSWFRVFSAAFRWVDGRLAHVVSSADITDNKRNEEAIHYMAHYDSLTKLPNRRMLLSECERRIDRATETEKGYLLFFDIDGFKAVNDNYGHDAGDEFLVRLGEFFSGIPLLKDGIYRNGGDEFVAIIGGENITKANILDLARFIHERFKRPWELKSGKIYCNTSIGVACYPEDGLTAEKLLRHADMAMYQVKKAGGGGIAFREDVVEQQALLRRK